MKHIYGKQYMHDIFKQIFTIWIRWQHLNWLFSADLFFTQLFSLHIFPLTSILPQAKLASNFFYIESQP